MFDRKWLLSIFDRKWLIDRLLIGFYVLQEVVDCQSKIDEMKLLEVQNQHHKARLQVASSLFI